MRVSKVMDLGQLAELMGKEATQREAELMREFLVDECYDDTELVQESDWVEMVRDAVELAEAEGDALPRLAREAANDGGPPQAEYREAQELLSREEAAASAEAAAAATEASDGGPTESDMQGGFQPWLLE